MAGAGGGVDVGCYARRPGVPADPRGDQRPEASVNILTDKMVTQQELEWRTARSAEDQARTDAM